jgi:hypothetical protein
LRGNAGFDVRAKQRSKLRKVFVFLTHARNAMLRVPLGENIAMNNYF